MTGPLMSQPRFALYFTPIPQSRLARFGAAMLGYDCDTAESVPQARLDGIDAAAAARAAAEPARYGFHGTLMAPFELRSGHDVDDLTAMLATFAARRTPVALGRLEVAAIGAFTALVPAGTQDAVGALAAECLSAFDGFRAPLDERDRTRRLAAKLSPRQIELLERWGYPYVCEEFRFHMTLTGRLPTDERTRWIAALAAAFAPLAHEPVDIDAVSLLRQDDRAARFRVVAREKLKP
jgi:putative phosphonate metabolism protein